MTGQAQTEKNLAASLSVAAAVVLTAAKLGAGLASGSLGLLSEAAHSGIDLVAALVTLFAVRASNRPADREHPYGHGKFENLSALFETFLLLVTCLWIVHEGIQRLFFRLPHVDATAWAFLAVTVSIVIDLWRSRALARAARRHRSQALEADALHFSTDVWSSAVVLLGLILVKISAVTGIVWLTRADAVAALGVAAIVFRVGLRLAWRATADLVDTVSPALRDEITRAVEVDGVREVRQVRLRRSGAELFVDAVLTADRELSFQRVHAIAARVEAAVQALHPEADIMVKIDPVVAGREGSRDIFRRGLREDPPRLLPDSTLKDALSTRLADAIRGDWRAVASPQEIPLRQHRRDLIGFVPVTTDGISNLPATPVFAQDLERRLRVRGRRRQKNHPQRAPRAFDRIRPGLARDAPLRDLPEVSSG